MEKLAQLITAWLKTDIDFLKFGDKYGPATYVGIIGIVAIFVTFLISMSAGKKSRCAKLSSQFRAVTRNIAGGDPVDEDEIVEFNKNFASLPESVKRGWSGFLSIRTKYPSEYILEKDILDDPEQDLNSNKFKTAFYAVSAIVAVLSGLLMFITHRCDLKSGLSGLLFGILAIAVAVIPSVLLFVFLKKPLENKIDNQKNILCAEIGSFLLALDNRIILYRPERDEFSWENIEEIDAAIERILGGKLGYYEIDDSLAAESDELDSKLEFVPTKPVKDDEIVEPVDAVLVYEESIVRVPESEEVLAEVEIEDVEEEPEVEDVLEEINFTEVEEPVEVIEEVEDIKEPEPEEVSVIEQIKLEEGEEDISTDLVELVQAVDAAVQDPITTVWDLEELTFILYEAQQSGIFERKVEKLIFDTCFEIVAEIYFKAIE
ncbi:MAG: hypothetical protein LBE09_01255 [Christensenellaceae bacterium]|jgi:hypothetical protein|nr:hypothetical protein [Christensenellaceae bacterium]